MIFFSDTLGIYRILFHRFYPNAPTSPDCSALPWFPHLLSTNSKLLNIWNRITHLAPLHFTSPSGFCNWNLVGNVISSFVGEGMCEQEILMPSDYMPIQLWAPSSHHFLKNRWQRKLSLNVHLMRDIDNHVEGKREGERLRDVRKLLALMRRLIENTPLTLKEVCSFTVSNCLWLGPGL